MTAALDRLLSIEVEATEARRLAGRLRFACLPTPASLEDFDYDAAAGVDRKVIEELATCRYLETATNVLLIGPPRVGKTHLSVGLARAAAHADIAPTSPPRPTSGAKSSATTPSTQPCSTASYTARSCSTSMATPTAYATTTPEPRNSAERPPEPDNHYSEDRSRVGIFVERSWGISLSLVRSRSR